TPSCHDDHVHMCICHNLFHCLRGRNFTPLKNKSKCYIINFGWIFSDFHQGALAQLGECLHGMQEDVGSSPTCSITEERLYIKVWAFFCLYLNRYNND